MLWRCSGRLLKTYNAHPAGLAAGKSEENMNILEYIEYWMEQGISEADAELAASMEFDIWESEE